MATYHVRPRPPGNPDEWAVEKRGASRASSVKGTKASALGAARSMTEDGDTLVIHSASGSVEQRKTVSNAARRNAKKNFSRSIGDSPFEMG